VGFVYSTKQQPNARMLDNVEKMDLFIDFASKMRLKSITESGRQLVKVDRGTQVVSI
jgi:hypothetical protein